MYNLKIVYGVISFNKSRIKVLVVERADSGKINCLYNNCISLNYLNANNEFINKEELSKTLLNILTKADEFIGIVVKRYIVNISYMPIEIVKNISVDYEIKINKELDLADYMSYTSKINFLNNNSDKTIIDLHPYLWTLDGINYSEFPYGKTGKNINFEYYAYVANSQFVKAFKDLVHACKVSIIDFINNQLSFGGLLTRCNLEKKNVVIDVKSDSSTINFYDTHNILVYYETLNWGSDWMIDQLRHKFNIPENVNLIPIIDSLEIINIVDSSTSLINVHKPKFLNLMCASAGELTKYVKIINQKFINTIQNKIDDILCRKNELSYDHIYLNANNMGYSLLDISTNINYEFFRTNIIGIDDNNIDVLVGSIEHTYNIQKTKKHIKYSIDPYVSQEYVNKNVKRDVLLNIGLITTKWSAKLGG